ncbi:MAG: hypothetical protein K8S62_06805 [Candidatus Sabulitectum sp.]|nr:hypothetical protein [Candidatus Sabulitectum sp.]
MANEGTYPRIVCMCGREIGYRIADFLLDQQVETRFAVNENEKTGDWYRTPRELDIIEISEYEIPAFKPDLIIVAFYHRIIPESIFTLPRYGCWNLHLGDAERYRGAYPNIHALCNGDTSYAVTLHKIDQGIDTGDILSKISFPITPEMTGRELYSRMTGEGLNLFLRHYSDLINGRALEKTHVQNSTEAVTHFRKELSHEVYPSEEFINSVRALTFPPFPPPYFKIGDHRFIVVEDKPESSV